MDAEFAKRWVARLRDPSLKQAKGCLFDGTGYCCLGVAEVEAGSTFEWSSGYELETSDPDDETGAYVLSHAHECGETLSYATACRIGMILDEQPNYTGRVVPMGTSGFGSIEIAGFHYSSLAEANDDGRTFDQIADWIEANYEKL